MRPHATLLSDIFLVGKLLTAALCEMGAPGKGKASDQKDRQPFEGLFQHALLSKQKLCEATVAAWQRDLRVALTGRFCLGIYLCGWRHFATGLINFRSKGDLVRVEKLSHDLVDFQLANRTLLIEIMHAFATS